MFLVKYVLVLCNIYTSIHGNILEKTSKEDAERRGMSEFIVGGMRASVSMFPYVAQIGQNQHLLCGGSIISVRVILTAAHCLMSPLTGKGFTAGSLEVYLGSSQLMKGAKYKVCKVWPHENFEYTYYDYDIGLILLQRSIIFGPLVQKISIAPNEKWKNDKYTMTVAGFGMTMNWGPASTSLQMTHMRYVDSNSCNKSHTDSEPMYVPSTMFCMLGTGWTSDCFGDSGSGIIWKRYLVGIVATGRDLTCGSDVVPSMYTNAVRFRSWIKTNVKKLESLSTRQCVLKKHRKKLHLPNYRHQS